MIDREAGTVTIPAKMRAIRLRSPGLAGLAFEEVATPRLGAGDALVRVHAAAVTRDELDWPVDRLPAIPSYELSGIVAAVAPGVEEVTIGEAVYALTGFDRDGAAADYVAVSARVLAPKPRTMDHLQSAAVPLAALSAWQGLFDHGLLQPGERVLITGAAGGVGHFATQLARWRGAYVIGTASSGGLEAVRELGANEAVDGRTADLTEVIAPVDLAFDTVGGALLEHSSAVVRHGGRLISIAAEPHTPDEAQIDSAYFIVAPNRDELVEIARLADDGALRATVDSVFPLPDARAAFERSMASGKRGKVVIQVAEG